MSQTYICPAGKIPSICKARMQGYWLANCPLIKSGIYKEQIFPIYNDFYQQDIVKEAYIKLRTKNDINFVNGMVMQLPQKQTFNFWERFSGLFQVTEKAYSLFSSVKTLCDENSINFEKALAIFEGLELFNGITYNDSKEGKKALARISIDYAKNQALSLIQDTREYQNANDKDYIIFGIQLASESAKNFSERLIDKIR